MLRLSQVTTEGVVEAFCGSEEAGSDDDEASSSATFREPRGVSVDGACNVLVADSKNHKIRAVLSTGSVTTAAGCGKRGKADGYANEAAFNGPRSLCVDNTGTVYIADSGNHCIRRLGTDGQVCFD